MMTRVSTNGEQAAEPEKKDLISIPHVEVLKSFLNKNA
jgi:hypothetical protein